MTFYIRILQSGADTDQKDRIEKELGDVDGIKQSLQARLEQITSPPR